MRIKTDRYKTKIPPKMVPSHKNYTEKQLEPADKVELSFGPKEKEWTLLFYNAGEGSEGKRGTAALLDLEKVGSDENTSIVAMNYRSKYYMDRFTRDYGKLQGARTYYVTKNEDPPNKMSLISKILPEEAKALKDYHLTSTRDITSPVIEEHSPDINMGDKDTLKNFIIDNMKKFPAKHYAVIMTGEGKVFSGSMAVDKPDGIIRNEELGQVFRDVEKETGHKIDLLDMNTSFGANVESLYPLRNSVETVVASEDMVWAGSQPLGEAVKDLQKGIKEGKDLSGKELARLFIEEARRQPLGNIYNQTLSAFHMDKMGEVAEDIKSLQKVLLEEKVPPASIKEAMEESLRFDLTDDPKEIYVADAGSFAEEITKHTDSPGVKKAAEKLKKSLKDCVFSEQHATHAMESFTSRILRNYYSEFKKTPKLEKSSGLTVYYDPDSLHPDSMLDELEGRVSISTKTIDKLKDKIETDKLKDLTGKEFSRKELKEKLKKLKFDKEEINMISGEVTLNKSEYEKDFNAVDFLSYVSKASEDEKASRSLIRKGWDKTKDVHKKTKRAISKKTYIPEYFISFAEKAAAAVGIFAGLGFLGACGVPALQVSFGSLFTLKGPLTALKGIKDTFKIARGAGETAAGLKGVKDTVKLISTSTSIKTIKKTKKLISNIQNPVETFKDMKKAAKLASKEKLTSLEKENIVDNIGSVGIGLTLGALGLHLLGVLPAAVVWPAALAAIAIRNGKEMVKLLINRKDHKKHIKEAEEFTNMPTSEKLSSLENLKKSSS